MTGLIAIGAGIAVLTGIGAGVGIGIATSKASGSDRKTAGSKRCDQQYSHPRLRAGGSDCYLRSQSVALVIILVL